jgi:hypothetical protein
MDGMLTLEDCLGLCGLTEEEVLAIAQHEHIPEMAALEIGSYLCRTPAGELCIKAMIRDDIAEAARMGEHARSLALRLVLRHFVASHPRCDERHLKHISYPDRRIPREHPR